MLQIESAPLGLCCEALIYYRLAGVRFLNRRETPIEPEPGNADGGSESFIAQQHARRPDHSIASSLHQEKAIVKKPLYTALITVSELFNISAMAADKPVLTVYT